ncbi:antibiotic biosynthesis monooxygenase family protein [Chryseobacterium sediminis]|uniref:antibiotic biosynthesis monooxygenase family protein n=1 Tax=Chryseobacterium sediminis TaxID=1679494 RepID=UPI002864CFE7|nr:antibiotic biosynthesis monooxygenase family protein [Chryseobacterium sediminis]MDR6464564.1 heme-degrading monooxygenase HmoA [Chryseobacterium sediminis]
MEISQMYKNITIMDQLNTETSSVVLVNIFQVAAEDADALTSAWENDANFMKKQPGFISTQLHKAIGTNTTFLNYAVWESTTHFRAAFNHPEFRNALKDYPSSAETTPLLFQRLSVPNLCVGD